MDHTNLTMLEYVDLIEGLLISQGCPSRSRDGTSCKYWTEEGAKCALGMLIPADKYDPCMEAYTPGVIPQGAPLTRVRGTFLLNKLFTDEGAPFRPSDARTEAEARLFWNTVQGYMHDDISGDGDWSGGVADGAKTLRTRLAKGYFRAEAKRPTVAL